MTWNQPDDAPSGNDPQLLHALASDLRAADYTVTGVAQLLGSVADAALGRDQPVPALLRTRELLRHDPAGPAAVLAVVVQLWLLGCSVSREQLTTALPGAGVDGAVALGLVEPNGDRWRAAVDLRPYGIEDDADLWVASDLGARQRPGVLRRDHVLGIGQASLSLAQFTVRADVDRALDVGTGCGIQIFHLLRHARSVVATDVSARALAFARFNLLLNADALGLDPLHLEPRVELRCGSLLEPVVGERFDLVVSNPPFVITPRPDGERPADRFTYRDGGLAGDDIVATLLRGVPAVLAPGGVAQMLGNWEIRRAATSWHARLESWLSTDVDAWVIQREELSPEEYAELWLRDAAENRNPQQYEAAYARYLLDFASRAVNSIGFGMVWLRSQDSAAPLRRLEEITHVIEQPLAPHIAAAVQRHDWLTAHNDQQLLTEHLTVAADVTEERHQRPGAEHPGVILLRQGGGLRRTTLLSSELAGFVSVCDGELSAGQIISALAGLLERDDSGFGTELLGEVRNLVEEGFLAPAEVEAGGPIVTDISPV